MPPKMWRSWSKKGHMDTAAAMGVPVETIIRTSNHLESFNGKLKGAEIAQWQHSGRRLRFDVLTYHLVIDILPRIFAPHRIANTYSQWKTEHFRSAARGVDLRSASGTSSALWAPWARRSMQTMHSEIRPPAPFLPKNISTQSPRVARTNSGPLAVPPKMLVDTICSLSIPLAL